MIFCQSCGQSNDEQNAFCRFCGTHFSQMQNQTDFGEAPPRPYVWKTDELEINRAKQRKTEQFRFNDSSPAAAPVEKHPFQTQQLVYQKPYGMVGNHGCPRCSSTVQPHFEKKISNAGWIVFAVLLVTFFPLFWIGLLIKEDIRVCPVCSYRYD